MAKVLLIDDDETLLDVLSMALSDEGHTVLTAADGIEGLAEIEHQAPDIIISDVNMPRLDGFALCRRLRESGVKTPLILLTSRADEIDEALGLELGADDYVTKPLSVRILNARVAALMRRESFAEGQGRVDDVVVRGPLSLDPERLQLRYLDVVVSVTVSEFRLIEALASRPGVVFSRDQLLDRVRGDDSIVAQRIIDTYIRRLRRKLETVDASFTSIETVVGAGYRWVENA